MELILLQYLLHYILIGVILTLPLIAVIQQDQEGDPITPRELFLSIFLWPWLWILLINMFVKFIIGRVC